MHVLPVKNNPVKILAAVGIGTVLFFVLGRFVAIPSPVPNTNISTQYGLLAFMAAVFGPVVGCIIGLIGHVLIDASYGRGIWWSWVIASAAFGLIAGFLYQGIELGEGKFTNRDRIRFNLYQAVAHVVAWGSIAPVLDILIYAEPVKKVFLQGLVACIANIVTTAVIGTLLGVAYSTNRPKKD